MGLGSAWYNGSVPKRGLCLREFYILTGDFICTAIFKFGHDVPDLQNLTIPDILFVFGVAAIGSILTYTIANHLRNRRKEKLKSEGLISSIT